MKKITLALLCGTFSPATIAVDCGAIHDVAETIMEARQSGVPARELMEYLGPETSYGRTIIIEAFEMPLIGDVDPVLRNEIVSEFANKHYTHCLRLVSE